MPDEIHLIVTNTTTFVRGRMSSEVYQEFKRALGYRMIGAEFVIQQNADNDEKPWMKDWDGTISAVCHGTGHCKCPIRKEGMHFPSGLVSEAISFFKNKKITCKAFDKRDKCVSAKPISLTVNDSELEVRKYQEQIIDKAVDQGRGIIKLATGGGKTVVGASIIANLNMSPTVFYVTSKDLLKQAHSELSRFVLDNGDKLKVGMIGDGKCDICDINVMTIQTAIRSCGFKYTKFDNEEKTNKEKAISDKKRKEIKDLVLGTKCIFCDEVQHWRADTCQILSDLSKNAYYRYGMSATPFRNEGDDIMIESCFGKNICNINASYLIQHGYLVPPTIYMVPITNMRGQKGHYRDIYKNAIVYNTVRNNIISNIANDMFSNGKLVLILCQQIEHGKILEQLIPNSSFLHGSISSKKRKEHLQKMRDREAGITIATVIFDEGIDVRPLDTLIKAGGGKSQTRALQRVGRILRPYEGKTEATVIDFLDDCEYVREHSHKRRLMYSSEPEFKIETLNFE
jgi:superfamily II DNA or RNA helicase